MTQTQICGEYIQSSSPAGKIFELAQKNNCRPREIAQILAENGIELPDGWPLEKTDESTVEKIFTPELDSWLLGLTSEGIKPSEIADMAGLKSKQIRNRLGVLKRRRSTEPKAAPAHQKAPETIEPPFTIADCLKEIDVCMTAAMEAVMNPNQRTRAAGLVGVAVGEIRVLISLLGGEVPNLQTQPEPKNANIIDCKAYREEIKGDG